MKNYLPAIFIVFGLLAGAYFIPWQNINWGKIEMMPASSITVIGEAKTIQKNQIAQYTAGVSTVNDDKQTAINEVNNKTAALIGAVKNFGVAEEDIKTANLSVYQSEESYWEDGRQKSRKGQWRVSNSITIKLREVDEASALTDVLSQSGATNIYGPNFQMEDTEGAEIGLLGEAIKNAKEKAEKIAAESGKKLGEVISVNEGGSTSYPMPMIAYSERGGGGGAPVEPGSGTIYKSVTVIFELK